MCVDDYPFRHYSANKEKRCRRFVIVNEDEFARTYFVNISQFQQNGEVALCKILIYLSTKGLPIQKRKFYVPKFKAIIEPYSFCRVVFEALEDKEILIKMYPENKLNYEIFFENQRIEAEAELKTHQDQNYYCRFEDVDEEQIEALMRASSRQLSTENNTKMEAQHHQAKMIEEQQENSSKQCDKCQNCIKEEQNGKKIKQSERGIREVIQAVKVWRELYESKRANLTNSAKIIGISKKSLDDYYLVLRIGQVLGFDFANNLDKKMGDLRIFIRHQEERVTGKLGKVVRCFSLLPPIDLNRVMQMGRLFQ